jgi:hypothetical protein
MRIAKKYITRFAGNVLSHLIELRNQDAETYQLTLTGDLACYTVILYDNTKLEAIVNIKSALNTLGTTESKLASDILSKLSKPIS